MEGSSYVVRRIDSDYFEDAVRLAGLTSTGLIPGNIQSGIMGSRAMLSRLIAPPSPS